MALSRSENMGRIRSKDTRHEVLLRRALWSAGMRYRVHVADLPGRPDVVFPRAKVAVFVDGCFWHGCPLHYGRPRAPGGYWAAKLAGNVDRDRRRTLALEADGWRVVRLWEHEIRRALPAAVDRVRAVISEGAGPEDQWRVVAVTCLGDGDERRDLQLLRDPAHARYEVGPRVQKHV
jgi:DNA mismatch endonuclease, patch repair protein